MGDKLLGIDRYTEEELVDLETRISNVQDEDLIFHPKRKYSVLFNRSSYLKIKKMVDNYSDPIFSEQLKVGELVYSKNMDGWPLFSADEIIVGMMEIPFIELPKYINAEGDLLNTILKFRMEKGK